MRITLGQPYSFCLQGQRPNQEDARFPDDDRPNNPKPFFAVCDGVGGCEAGEVASRTVCKTLGRVLGDIDWNGEFTRQDLTNALAKAYKALDRAANSDKKDMATTLTLAAFHQGGCTIAHIGDSRVYQFRPSEGIVYRSEDHSLVASLIHGGLLSPDAADSHPNASTITRYMCPTENVEERFPATVLTTTDIEEGDYFLLCTDGVLDCVDDEQMTEVLCKTDVTDEQKLQMLAIRCQKSRDNSTAILIPVKAVEEKEELPDQDDNETGEQANITKRTHVRKAKLQDVDAEEKTLINKITNFIDKIF